MAGFDQILYLGIVGIGVYMAYSTGLLDKAGQQLVTATAPKGQGYAKHKKKKIVEVLVPVVPQKRIRLTMA